MKTMLTLVILFGYNIVSLCANSAISPKNNASVITEFEIPFRLVKKLIVIEAKVDQQTGWFILDTGLPDLILNKNRFKQKGKEFNFLELTGKDVPATKFFFTFQLGDTKFKGRDGMAMDLSHLERKTKIPLMGLIGRNMLKKFEIVLDYKAKIITFYRLNKRGKKLTPYAQKIGIPSDTIPVTWKGHLLALKVKWANRIIRFGLDTGAGINIIAPKYAALLKEIDHQQVQVKLMNIGSLNKGTSRKSMNKVIIGTKDMLPMKTITCDFSVINANLAGKDIDGLLGYEFFKQQKVAINFKRKQLFLWKKPPMPGSIFVLNEPKNKNE